VFSVYTVALFIVISYCRSSRFLVNSYQLFKSLDRISKGIFCLCTCLLVSQTLRGEVMSCPTCHNGHVESHKHSRLSEIVTLSSIYLVIWRLWWFFHQDLWNGWSQPFYLIASYFVWFTGFDNEGAIWLVSDMFTNVLVLGWLGLTNFVMSRSVEGGMCLVGWPYCYCQWRIGSVPDIWCEVWSWWYLPPRSLIYWRHPLKLMLKFSHNWIYISLMLCIKCFCCVWRKCSFKCGVNDDCFHQDLWYTEDISTLMLQINSFLWLHFATFLVNSVCEEVMIFILKVIGLLKIPF